MFDRLRAAGARWPTRSHWINPDWKRHTLHWIHRPVVLEVGVWAQTWAWERWRQDHPQAWAALDLDSLDTQLSALWRQDLTWAGNPGTGSGGRAFQLPPSPVQRLDQARARQPRVQQALHLHQALDQGRANGTPEPLPRSLSRRL